MGRFETIVAARQRLCEATLQQNAQTLGIGTGRPSAMTPTQTAQSVPSQATQPGATPGAQPGTQPGAQPGAQQNVQTPAGANPTGAVDPVTGKPKQTPNSAANPNQQLGQATPAQIDPATGAPVAQQPTAPTPGGQTPEMNALSDINNRVRQYYNGQTPPTNSQIR